MKRAILSLTPELFVQFVSATKEQGGRRRRFRVKKNPLPEDCRCVDVHYDPERCYLTLLLESEAFPEELPGRMLPMVPSPVYEAIYDDEDAVRRTVEAKIEALKNVLEKAEALLSRSSVDADMRLSQWPEVEDLMKAILAARVATGDLREHRVKKVEGGEG